LPAVILSDRAYALVRAAVFSVSTTSKTRRKIMKSKALSIVLAGILAATMFVMCTTAAHADYPRSHAGHVYQHSHGGHVYFSPGGVSFGNGRVGISFGGGYAPSRFQYQPNYWGTRPQYQPSCRPTYRQPYRPTYRPTYVTPQIPYVPNQLIVPRYNYGAYRQFYIDPSNYSRNSSTYGYPAPYGTGVERYEFLRFQQETRDQLRQLSEQQRRSNVEQQQLERGQQQLQLGQQRLQREQSELERELQDIQNLLRK
jgi:hypothetical protein